LRFERMSGLDEEQLGELECRVSELLEEPWDKEEGRPRELPLREALIVEAYAKPSEAAPPAACVRRSESFLIIFTGSFA
jgi:hypothetical protein